MPDIAFYGFDVFIKIDVPCGKHRMDSIRRCVLFPMGLNQQVFGTLTIKISIEEAKFTLFESEKKFGTAQGRSDSWKIMNVMCYIRYLFTVKCK